jgi:hypothetical protein
MNNDHQPTHRLDPNPCREGQRGARLHRGFAHACGWLAGWLIVQAAKAFVRAGDAHEVVHCCAALAAGNSERCEPARCQLDPTVPVRPDRMRAAQNGGAAPATVEFDAERRRS